MPPVPGRSLDSDVAHSGTAEPGPTKACGRGRWGPWLTDFPRAFGGLCGLFKFVALELE